MAWFSFQSLVVIILAFLLGLLVGWLWWRRRKVQFSQSDAVSSLTTRHAAALASKQSELDRVSTALGEKDAEIGRLSGLVDGGAVAATADAGAQHEAALADATAQHQAALADATAQHQAALADVTATHDAALADLRAQLDARDAEIARLSGVIDQSEAQAAAHREELAGRDARCAGHETAIADRDAEIARLSAATATAATGSGDGVTLQPTHPTPESVAAYATPVEHTGALDLGALEATTTSPASDAADTAEPPVPAHTVVDLTAAGTADTAAAAPSVVADDDLERVEGIGPRIGAALRGAGIRTFRQVADADISALQAALEQAGLRFAPSLPTWGRQAALLADGDEAGFLALTEQLVAGRDITGTK